MALEIERKFLLAADARRSDAGRVDVWRSGAEATELRQGYLAAEAERSVRVRLARGRGTLTIKGPGAGAVRGEWEYEIPAADAEELLELCHRPLIEKTRWRVTHAGRVWEIDEFRGANAGLVLAECELPDAEAELVLPSWVGREVTGDERYYNAYLARRPFGTWTRGAEG